MEQNLSLSQRERYKPSGFTRFCWWLATAEPELLADAVIDRNRYRIIGMSVLATWAFATIAWSYFFYTVSESWAIALLMGFFMGLIILTIDRALIKGINRFNKQKFWPLLFRGILALTIGTFMAQPAILYLFDKEIKLQVSLDNEQRKMIKRQELDSLFKNRKSELLQKQQQLQASLDHQYALVNAARDKFIAETDGSGGSGKVGIKDIALAKQREYQKLDQDYQLLLATVKPQQDSIRSALGDMESKIKAEEAVFTQYLNNGFLTRVTALQNLLKNNSALQFRYYLIVFILMLIELMPVIAKTILPGGSYDEKLMLREEMEIALANSNIRKEQRLKELYNQLAFEQDDEAIRAFFEQSRQERNEKMKKFTRNWQEDDRQSFDSLWERIKNDLLTKQEN